MNMKHKAKIFHFVGYEFDVNARKIFFKYRIEFYNQHSLNFTETIIFPNHPKKLKEESIQKILESLLIVLGISYYKLYCPPRVTMPFRLSREQADFWNTVYRKGLGEFLYRNKLDPKRLAKFSYSNIKIYPDRIKTQDRALLGIGGGKDSIVAAELLKDFDIVSFLVETQKQDLISDSVIDKIGRPSLKIRRVLDLKIFEKHDGAYNGHIPISAIFAFLGLLTAAIYEYKYVIVANEHSSNFGNLQYKGEIINHQWSKSVEFESLFQEYTRKFITPDIVYFSLLRQFYEIRIARMFVEHKKYFPLFASCNRNFRVFKDRPGSLWCGECPKCAFAFLMLASFVGKKEVIGIFKKNLFADKLLLPLFQDLLGFGKLKPFDCVGTFEESQTALFLASKKFKNEIIIKTFLPKIRNPEKLIERVFKTYPAPTVPTPFRFLGIKNVCILGYGKEGKITEKYIKKNHPNLKIGILDQTTDKKYLERQKNYDLAIKTPGIAKEKVKIPYTTATNIFFSQNKNFIIGVTGSKGKSTTASLIYEIIKASGKKVRLIGNIGNPMLEVLFTKIDPNEIFVAELSSYMLDDIEYSPNIALLLNLFPDHMDYHGGVENYYKAKKNFFKFQKQGDLAVKPPFDEKIPLQKSEIPLIGAHNIKNIKVAVKVARVLGISDSVIKKAVINFKPLPHRLEFVGEFKGINFYDDAISTTPESTIVAIRALKNIGTIFLGGEDRGYDFRELEKTLRKYKIKNIALFPESGRRVLKSKQGFNVLETRSMKEAVRFAFKNTPKGQICLLSTASPSYSVWKNFEEKGNLFQRSIKQT
ncbi:MAG: UDP-N-acetylmuramoyl-L-alanine-D-glutamate ligase [Parcubacteria group bacterium GW2011_GWA1_40_21]|nr:MAG: UDP-N-acetylmuramoyl-L-alanine-D-glutamate ligase [Parcubacteria group bacterium GW2011_GWA1_40_21]